MRRASVTFPPELYRTLGELDKKGVSLALLVREGAEQNVAAERSAFGNSLLREGK